MSYVAVVGGANIDFKAQTLAVPIPQTSNIGNTASSLGGVGRNIAENLARLAVPVMLVSVVGEDALGRQLLEETARAGVNTDHMLYSTQHRTGSYTALLDHTGELYIAVADMHIMAELTPEKLSEKIPVLHNAHTVILDANIPPETLGYACQQLSHTRIIIEPVSIPKALRLKAVLGHNVFAITPNMQELQALSGQEVQLQPESIQAACDVLHQHNIHCVAVSLGEHGSYVSEQGKGYAVPPLPCQVQEVTGAGDALLSGWVYGLHQGLSIKEAMLYGHAAACITLESSNTVSPELSTKHLQKRKDQHAGHSPRDRSSFG